MKKVSGWTICDRSDSIRSTDIIYTRRIVNFWAFGITESVRVIEMANNPTNDIYELNDGEVGPVVIHSRFFWMKEHAYATPLNIPWRIYKFFTPIINKTTLGRISHFVEKFPFIEIYSVRHVRKKKLGEILTK